ncbi:amino acid ABC transporter ATP-binding protein [Paenibacillus silvisoli]|uniref:amino acid ABC transporter ATP-binding protein n=1 Tax=Paenibacillus silvisoli TaxID=3110539 RepID=UPI0028063A96|nr:amino acid ABC transporter ATP-binding protein [Paenibacillus silvisoli]
MNAQLEVSTPAELSEKEKTAADARKPFIQYERITKRFQDHEVIKGVDLSLHAGEKLVLIGPSGSGKTTLGRMLMTLEQPTSGRILIDGESLWEMESPSGKTVQANEKHLRRMRSRIGMVFQHFNLFPHLSVLDNVTLALRCVRRMTASESYELALSMLGKVGLAHKLNEYPSKLSGGQKQRVAIARALVMQPKVMIFDEVTSALDPELVGEVLSVMKEIATTTDMAMMIITHEMDFAREIADHVIFGSEGSIVEQGTPEDIFERPQSERLRSFLKRFR